jgi:hypothetical protein
MSFTGSARGGAGRAHRRPIRQLCFYDDGVMVM